VPKTPWINPARRGKFTGLAVIALLLVAALAFVGGIAVGDDGHERGPGRRDAVPCAARQCGFAGPGQFGNGPGDRNNRPGGPNWFPPRYPGERHGQFPGHGPGATPSTPASPTPSSSATR
jgi:hypothetical protein